MGCVKSFTINKYNNFNLKFVINAIKHLWLNIYIYKFTNVIIFISCVGQTDVIQVQFGWTTADFSFSGVIFKFRNDWFSLLNIYKKKGGVGSSSQFPRAKVMSWFHQFFPTNSPKQNKKKISSYSVINDTE